MKCYEHRCELEREDVLCVCGQEEGAVNLWACTLRSQHCNGVFPALPSTTEDHCGSQISAPRGERTACISATPRRRSNNLAGPSRCPYTLSCRFIIILGTLLFLTSSTFAAPLQHEKHWRLLGRQAIPDRFGNTGFRPVSLPARPSPPPPPSPQPQPPPSRVPTSTSTPPSTNPIPESATSAVPIPNPNTPSSTTLTPAPTPISIPPPSSSLPPLSPPPSPSPYPTPSTSTLPSLPTPPPQLQLLAPPTQLSASTITGITLGSLVFLLLLFTTYFVIKRRSRARQIREIDIHRSANGSRLAGRVFGAHYDERIKRSRSKTKREKEKKALEMQSSVTSWGNVGNEKFGGYWNMRKANSVAKMPVSPSIYSQMGLTRFSRMSVGGWLDRNTVVRPKTGFVGTESQMRDAPRPLFAGQKQVKGEGGLGVGWKGDIGAPRPARPRSAAPLGQLSGMGFGLGVQ